jgi:hypothetical protein
MGYMKHNAIIVTSWDKDKMDKAYAKAKETLGALVSPIIEGVVNSQYSFFVAPDGSKEGWAESNEYDEKRKDFLDWLIPNKCMVSYIEVRFGGDDEHESIVRSLDTDLNKIEA